MNHSGFHWGWKQQKSYAKLYTYVFNNFLIESVLNTCTIKTHSRINNSNKFDCELNIILQRKLQAQLSTEKFCKYLKKKS